jgi:xylan 1,4-beta-xylosidase
MKLPCPLIPGFHPDPSIVQVGDDYYLATSTFEYLPGIPIHHSRDLVEWTLIGHVGTRADQLGLSGVTTSGGVWAPTIRWRDGLFYVIVTVAMGRGMLCFTASDPSGPWSDGVVLDLSGIDPDVAWDSEGTAIVTFSGLLLPEGTHLGIQQARVDLVTGERLEEPRSIWSGTGLMFPEAPHLYEIGKWWYLLLAEGGTERGHAVSVARSDSPYGPWESCPSNPVLSARSTARPVQNTGHSDLVQAPDGSWVLVLLGMRVRGLTRSFSSLGRETFATQVDWVDEWPMPRIVEQPLPANAPVFFDDFSSPVSGSVLGPEWIGVRRFPLDVAVVGAGALTLNGEGRTMDDAVPTFVGRRQRRLDACIEAHVVGRPSRGGLTLRYDEQQHFDLEINGDTVVARACLMSMTFEQSVSIPEGAVTLRMEMLEPGQTYIEKMTNDIVRLSVVDAAGVTHEVASFDGRYLTAETACSFTGRVAGVYCVDGTMTVSSYSERAVA